MRKPKPHFGGTTLPLEANHLRLQALARKYRQMPGIKPLINSCHKDTPEHEIVKTTAVRILELHAKGCISEQRAYQHWLKLGQLYLGK